MMFYCYGKFYFLEYTGIDIEKSLKERGPVAIWKPKQISLCKYFWSVVMTVFAFPWVVLSNKIVHVISKTNTSLLTNKRQTIIMYCSIGVLAASSFWWAHWWTPIFFVAAGLVGYSILPIVRLIDKLRGNKPIKAPKPKKKKEPNIMFEYIKARKQKFCPIIQFVDPEKAEMWK